jgi:protein-tyrosine phosphatase
MEETINKFNMWRRSKWPYWIYAKAMFAIQPYRDDTFEATQIIKNLWIGDIRSPCNKKSLEEHGIHTIVSAVYGATAYHPFKFNYEKADLRDTDREDILKEIKRLLPLIHQELVSDNGVLVHCMQGASRSATIVAAYLMKYHNMLAKEAISFMQNKRSCVNPNDGYVKQLIEYEDELHHDREQHMIEKKEK